MNDLKLFRPLRKTGNGYVFRVPMAYVNNGQLKKDITYVIVINEHEKLA